MTNKENLRRIIEERDTPLGLRFDLFIQFMIVVSLISFSLETVPDLSDSTRMILRYIEIFCVIIFTLEYILRVFVARKKRRFIFSFFGIIDLIAILPFYLSFGIDLKSLRAIRLLRIFRILKLARYNTAIARFRQAFGMISAELTLYFSVSMLLLYFAAVGIYYFENAAQPEAFSSVFASLWWAVATLTTVGYGDVYPITAGGKIFTFFVVFIGLGVVAVPAGLVASALSKASDEERRRNQEK